MITASIGARLTAWYVGVLAVALLVFGGGSWWLSTQSVVRAADAGLAARIDGVRAFLEDPETVLTVEDLREEFGEYAELTRGEALLEVVDGSGHVLCRPSVPGWTELLRRAADRRPADRVIGGMPFRVASAALDAHGQVYAVTVAAPMGAAHAALNRFHEWLLLLLLATILAAGAGGYFVSRRALAPVDDITGAVRAITVQRLDRRLPVPAADDELRRLASTFNSMLARLESAVGDIVRFTADASHELRTPVSLVRTTAEVALRHERSPDEYRAALADVAGQAQHLSSLIEDLMILARTDAGIEPGAASRFDLRDRVTAAVADVTPAAGARAVGLSVQMPASPVAVDGDPASLQRALVILLDNAVKYSHVNGEVRVTLEEPAPAGDGARVVLVRITDEGIGLDEAERPRLFERFYRGTRARQHAPDGTGLGLAIARAIVERHGGTLDLASTEGARGCRATMMLPLT